MALDRLLDDMAPCKENTKLRVVGNQLDFWWNGFWDKGDELADAIIGKNKAEHKIEHMK